MDLKYICRFTYTPTSGAAVIADSPQAVSPMSSSSVQCAIPTWSQGSQLSVSTNVSLWVHDGSKVLAMVPFLGTSNGYIFNRCSDGVKNGDETDVDCGGSCAGKCAAGKACLVSGDCGTALACGSSKKCVAGKFIYWHVAVLTASSFFQASASCYCTQKVLLSNCVLKIHEIVRLQTAFVLLFSFGKKLEGMPELLEPSILFK